MSRWEPDAAGRLTRAALALYAKRGFDQTTVAEIAKRAGLTERTFFRYFVDKRDVLFAGSAALQEAMVGAVASAPQSSAPLDAVGTAVESAGRFFNDERRDFARQRQAVIAANAELRERELIKLATLASAIAETLRRRGTEDPAASLAAEAGVAVFKIAFERWIADSNQRDFPALVRESLAELKTLAAARSH